MTAPVARTSPGCAGFATGSTATTRSPLTSKRSPGVRTCRRDTSVAFKAAYGESPYSYLMTRRIERAMTLLRRGDLSVTQVCFAVGYGSLGTFSTRFTELVGMPPSTFRELDAEALRGIPPCVTQRATKPVRNREAGTHPLL